MTESSGAPGVTSAIFVLAPSESKRLIAKAVAAMPVVQRALRQGRVIIATGSTNAYVAEEILGIALPKERYVSGNIAEGSLGTTRDDTRIRPFVISEGKPVEMPWPEALPAFTAADVFIKGANAVDFWGNVGIILAGNAAGTIGLALGTVVARGAHLIVPVGLEKLIPSVVEAAHKTGQRRIAYPEGEAIGLMPLVSATVVTEISAFRVLFDLSATQVAAGGINGAEGSVVLVAEGRPEQVGAALDLVGKIKGEPPFPSLGDYRLRYGKDFATGQNP